MPVIESSGPPQRCTFHLKPKGVRGMLLLIPLGFAVNTERETDPVSILFHVFPQGPATLGFWEARMELEMAKEQLSL